MTAYSAARPLRTTDALFRTAIVGLALSTAFVHSTLGGPLFTLNAIGYVVGAVAMIAPLAIVSRFRWAVRVGLVGYAASTIVAWTIQGPFYTTAYLAKAIESALIVLLVVDFVRFDGNPAALISRQIRAGVTRARRLVGMLGFSVLALAIVAGCSGASGNPTPPSSIDSDALTVTARNLAFSTSALSAPAGTPFQIAFENQEGIPHNVSIYRNESAEEKILVEEPFAGPRVVMYSLPALAPGDYFFRCDVHPDMNGTLTVG
jgi:plastocyanin